MNRHRIDLVSLVAGLATVAVAVTLLAPGVDTAALGRLLPAGIIAVGVALLLSGRNGERTLAEDTPAHTSAATPAGGDNSPASTRAVPHPEEQGPTPDASAGTAGDTLRLDDDHTAPGHENRQPEAADHHHDVSPQDVTRRLDNDQTDRRE